MLYGFIDESGTPGLANKPIDYLAVSLVICDSLETVIKIQSAIAAHRRRNGLPPDYEFHCSSNSVAQQEKFVQLMTSLNFTFVTASIKKDKFKNTATYEKIATTLLDVVVKLNQPIKIKMDTNPALYKILKAGIKQRQLQKTQVRQAKSKSMDLLQVVDYVVNISVKQLKGKKNGQRWYPKIKNKRID